MILSASHVDNAVHVALEELKKTGVSFDSDEYCILNERLTDFLTDDCHINVVESFSFTHLQEDQFMAWMKLARKCQEDRGENTETISSEETEKEAAHLFELHNGYLPASDSLPGKVDIEKAAKAHAANIMFDLQSGEQNADVAKVLSPEEIYDAVQLSASLNIHVDAVGYELEPYCSYLTHDDVIQVLVDLKTGFESELQEYNRDNTTSNEIK